MALLDLFGSTFSHPEGFWGPVTATVDWCEDNYVRSPYIAEFFNTLSSLAMVGFGALGLWRFRRRLAPRFLLAFAVLGFVGVGSVLFHATLRFLPQLLDELPMVYLVLVIVFILLEGGWARRLGRAFPWLLGAYGALLTVLCAGSRGQTEFWAFQIGFGSLELFCLTRTALLYRRSTDAKARTLFRWGMSAYPLGILVWFIDLRFCPTLGGVKPQLHAVWHVLVSFGFYMLLVFISEALDGSARLRCPGSELPERSSR